MTAATAVTVAATVATVAVTVAVRAPTPAEARRTLDNIQVQVDSATIGRRLAQDDAAGGSKLSATANEAQEQPKS